MAKLTPKRRKDMCRLYLVTVAFVPAEILTKNYPLLFMPETVRVE